jgi:hypothetical protein
VVRADLAWAHHHALPWVWRNLRGRSAGDGLTPKRPEPAFLRIGPSQRADGDLTMTVS